MTLSGIFLGLIYSYLPETFHNIEGLQKLIVNESQTFSMAMSIFITLFISSGIAAASGARLAEPRGQSVPRTTAAGGGTAWGQQQL